MNCLLKRYGLLVSTTAVLLSLSAAAVASGWDVPLERTAAAPAQAGGMAGIRQAGASATLVANLQGLGAGSYALDVVRKSDGSAVPLGMIVVTDPTAGPDLEANDDVRERGNMHSEDLKVQASVTLPPGLAPASIAQIRVKSTGGTILLRGRLGAPRASTSAKE